MNSDPLTLELLDMLKKGRVVGKDMLDFSTLINHRIEVNLLSRLCRRIVELESIKADAVCTAASSGIGFSTILGYTLNCPVIFAQKGRNPPAIMAGKHVLKREITSATKGNSTNLYLCSSAFEGCKKIVLADDFLFRGTTMGALIEMIKELDIEPTEVLVFVNKSFENGWKNITDKYNIPLKKVVSIDEVEVDGQQSTIHIDELLFEPCDIKIHVERYIPSNRIK